MNKKKKIAIVGNIPSMILNFRKELILELIEDEYEVHCFTYGFDENYEREIRAWGAHPHQHYINPKGLNPITDILGVFRLSKSLKKIGVDLIFSTFAKPVIFGSLASLFVPKIKRIGMIEGLGNVFIDDNKLSKKWLLKIIQVLLYKFILPKLDTLVLLNEDDKKDLLDSYSIAVKKLVILGGIGVDLNRFSYSDANVGKIKFLFIGRLLKEKGIFEYLQVAERIKSVHPEVEFIVAGSEDKTNPFSISKKELDYYIDNGIICYLGNVGNIEDVISDSSVFVLPSYREGMPRSTQEAMAIGRAVITTNVAGCKETVIEGLNGFLVERSSVVDNLEQKVLYFINNPSKIIEMGKESRLLAERNFDVCKKNKLLRDIFANVSGW